jgi:hypothetical protein
MLRDTILASNKGRIKLSEEKGIIHVRIDKTLNKTFRIEVTRLYGGERGALSRAVEEALRLWLKKKESSVKA